MPQESCAQYAQRDKTVDLGAVREEIEDKLDYTMVESEGPDCLRIDIGGSSVWVYKDCTIDGKSSKFVMDIVRAAVTKHTRD